ncbi:MAG: signal peptidase [Pedosphaera sp.]|nr:signal peptidase [Pedosphaera sp.]
MQGEPQSSGLLYWLRVMVIGRKPKRTLVRLVMLVVVTTVVFAFVLRPVRITGGSMEPTYHDHSINFINRLAYLRHPPQRGDVVGVRITGDHVMYMKRIVGLPGEAVSFSDGHVCIDGVPQEEPYLKFTSHWEVPPITLRSDEYYVVGDNRTMPPQDHTRGAARLTHISGRILFPGNR